MLKETIQIKLPDGSTQEFKKGTKVIDIIKYLGSGLLQTVAAVKIDKKLYDLYYEINYNCEIEIVTLDTIVGMKVYRRSVEYVLAIAIKELYGETAKLLVGPHIEKGYYFDLIRDNNKKISKKEIKIIYDKMNEIIGRKLKFSVKILNKKDAQRLFPVNPEISCLFDDIEDENIKIYYQKETQFADLYHVPILPNTKYIQAFDLLPFEPGFILQFPDYVNKILIMPKQPKQIKLTKIFLETREWYKIQGIENVAQLNKSIKTGKISDLIKVAEAFQEKKISQIADMIADNKNKIKFVTIAGPSSSGKTTFAKKLSIYLRVNGIFPVALSLDDYFVERENTPLDINGDYDFETIEALDLKLIHKHLTKLLNNETIEVPEFDFITGHRKKQTRKMEIKPGQVVIMEGIHGLNEKLTETIPSENKFKIYISALTQLRIDSINRIPTTDSRLVRRMVRDYKYRGYSAQETISRWSSVRRGEEKHIFPFQENADVMFNSALIYESAILKKYALPILREVPRTSKEYSYAETLIGFLRLFVDCPEDEIPPTSIIREFLGGSSFNY